MLTHIGLKKRAIIGNETKCGTESRQVLSGCLLKFSPFPFEQFKGLHLVRALLIDFPIRGKLDAKPNFRKIHHFIIHTVKYKRARLCSCTSEPERRAR